GEGRYNLLGNGGHWFPGQQAGQIDSLDLAPVLDESPFAEHIPTILAEAHEIFKGEDVQRLQED
ncbi:MAG: aldo/keto reductase, partial [Phycisphaerae bacterium]|nr:aldo/keto reductase [Phycisphaerae bacterium]